VRVSAKADYALRTWVELAAAEGTGQVKGERLAQAQGIPVKFLENILGELRQAGLVADVASGVLPEGARELVADPEAWAPHP
jgi:DNA-binding IscR family transcriptional regulator